LSDKRVSLLMEGGEPLFYFVLTNLTPPKLGS
jgi:hypothetical protein